MKKILIFVAILTISAAVWGQTWAVEGDENWDFEYTMIEQEQFARILRANEITSKAVTLDYQDVTEMEQRKVIVGKKPNLTGYYYLTVRRIAKSQLAKSIEGLAKSYIIYGNSEIGAMHIMFFSVAYIPGAIELAYEWNSYSEIFNKLISLINIE